MELQESLAQLKKKGLGLAAISYDSPSVLSHFAERKKITFPLLSDADSKIIREFGILNEAVPKDNMAYGVPHPVTLVVGPDGVVRSKHLEEDYRERYTVSNVLTEKYDLRTGAAETTIQTKHLKLTASASNEVVRSGERIRLLLDLELKPKMHVYAPGVEGYLAIDWKMKDSDGWKSFPVTYPPSKKLTLKAINETVPVYEGRFSLQKEITLAAAAKLKPILTPDGAVEIEGTLRYQACDDRVCYIPETLPLKWVLRYEAHDPQRVPAELQRKAGPK